MKIVKDKNGKIRLMHDRYRRPTREEAKEQRKKVRAAIEGSARMAEIEK